MKKAYIINTHEKYPFSPGKLNASLVELASEILKKKEYEVKSIGMDQSYDPVAEVERHLWADVIILQIPVNWMGVPWTFKRYMDHVYSAGLSGQLCDGDGRTRSDASRQYGSGGRLVDKKYMLSLTFNAPQASFGDPTQFFYEGKTPDDLFWPMHLNFKFFGMKPIPTFCCFDVMKNPDIEGDFKRFEKHLSLYF